MSEDRALRKLDRELAVTYSEIFDARRSLIAKYDIVYNELMQTARNCRKARVGAASAGCTGAITGAVAVAAVAMSGPVAWVATAATVGFGLVSAAAATEVGTSLAESCINRSILKKLEVSSQQEAEMLQKLEKLIENADSEIRSRTQQMAEELLKPLISNTMQSGALFAAGQAVLQAVREKTTKVAKKLGDETAEAVSQNIVIPSATQMTNKATPFFGANEANYGAAAEKYASPFQLAGAVAYSMYYLTAKCNELYADKPTELAEIVKNVKDALEKQLHELECIYSEQKTHGFIDAKPKPAYRLTYHSRCNEY